MRIFRLGQGLELDVHECRYRPAHGARDELLRPVLLLHHLLDDPALPILFHHPVHVVVHGPAAGDADPDARRRAADPEGESEKASKAAAFTCTNCGADVDESAEKCPKCGAVFEE
ncbi:MAG: zinc ribbon domain-containing protein [Methanobacteriota archaeon]|nr:MAG: zinc ribbon domain-containing protein [Euryarchaeota archaeon]